MRRLPAWLRSSGLSAFLPAVLIARAYAQAHGFAPPPLRLYAGVAAAAWFGGRWAGFGGALIAACLFAWTDVAPSRAGSDPHMLGTLLFGAEALLVAWLADLLRRLLTSNAARLTQQRGLAALARSALQGVDENELCHVAARDLARELGADELTVFQSSKDGAILVPCATYTRGLRVARSDPVAIDSVAGARRVLSEATPLVIDPVPERSRLLRLLSARCTWHVVAPIAGRRRSFGVLTATVSRRRDVRADDLHFIEATASLLATGLERRRAEREAARGRDALSFLADASGALATSLDRPTVVESVARLVVPALASSCVVDLFGAERDVERLVVEGPGAPVESSSVIRAPGLVEPTLVPDASIENLARAGIEPDAIALLARLGARSYLHVPLVANRRTLGVLRLAASAPRPRFDASAIALAEDFGRRVATALDNARLYVEQAAAERRKDEFLAMISHELRNPLAALSSCLDLMRARGDDAALRADVVPRMTRQLRLIRRLVTDLLDVSRINRGEIDLRRVPIELGGLLRAALGALEPLVHARGQRLALEATGGPLWVDADPARLEQVIGNLVDHASEVAGPGGEVGVRLGRGPGPCAELGVRDASGPSSVPQAAPGGLGAGRGPDTVLYLVRRLVELHGGRVSARSEDMGRGNERVVQLPLREAPATAAPGPDGARREGTAAALRIVLVDDHEDSAAGLAQLLRTWGHAVATAADGPSGLVLLREVRPDVALLDIALPGLDGYALARAVRATPELAPVLLIALTGFGYDQDRRKALDAGFDVHFTKPVDLERLRALLQSRRPTVETTATR